MKKQVRIRDAYISVEISGEALKSFRWGLRNALHGQGVLCEESSPTAHVSIAYTLGESEIHDIKAMVSEIAEEGFEVRFTGFEVLRGQMTPYDYLVMTIESDGDVQHAIEVVQQKMPIKQFDGGFRGHVSLLRFPKGVLEEQGVVRMIRELDASARAAFALGHRPCLQGGCVQVFNNDRQCCLQVPVSGSSTRAA